MNTLLDTLDCREKSLDYVIGKINRSRKKIPEGRIRICSSHGRTQYYLLKDSSDKVGEYIKHKDLDKVLTIAQNEYNQRVLKAAAFEKKCIRKFRKDIQGNQMEDLYDKIGKHRQRLITPVSLSDEEYVKKWLSVEYDGQVFINSNPNYYSRKGERMRSKSEVIIADLLDKYNVPYLYEFPVELVDIGTVHTDFRTLNVRKRKVILWEHYGMMDDYDYRDDKMVEIEKYNMSGYFTGENFIYTMETSKKRLNVQYVEMLIKHYCL